MMEWFSGWLKQLIVIVLVAGFIDLLLPSQALQRYVRTVIGLFLLMIMLSPVFQLFQHKWSPEQLMASAEQRVEGAHAGTYPTLSDIMKRASQLQLQNRGDAQQLLDSSLAGAIRTGVELTLQEKVEFVKVKTVIDDQGTPTIEAVDVSLTNDTQVKSSVTEDKPLVEPVKPVIVDIRPGEAAASESPKQAGGGQAADRTRSDAVKQFVSKEWQVKPERINVTFYGSDRK